MADLDQDEFLKELEGLDQSDSDHNGLQDNDSFMSGDDSHDSAPQPKEEHFDYLKLAQNEELKTLLT